MSGTHDHIPPGNQAPVPDRPPDDHRTPDDQRAPGAPSPWITRHAGSLPEQGQVLDLAAGSGRHTRYFSQLGRAVLAVDRDVAGLADLSATAGVEIVELDLEAAYGWPFPGRQFAGIVVTNYLHRPLLPFLGGALQPGGLLLYETFALGNERFGRPSNPAFLLQPGELLRVAQAAALTVLAYEHGEVTSPRPAVIQRIAAQKHAG
ncbi:MAG TPA: class I SAM-dependent methyltransferase [Terriglobia bacterium]|nr:class I SAM-dependent methyltransferase [Terriglobia bacterium]